MPGLNYRNATMKMRMTVDENIKQAIQKMYELERNFMGRMSSQRASKGRIGRRGRQHAGNA